MDESPLTVRADTSKRADLTVTLEAERITRYWPERDGMTDKPDRAFRIEVMVPCVPCQGLGWDWDDEAESVVECEACTGNGHAWEPLHWVERKADG